MIKQPGTIVEWWDHNPDLVQLEGIIVAHRTGASGVEFRVEVGRPPTRTVWLPHSRINAYRPSYEYPRFVQRRLPYRVNIRGWSIDSDIYLWIIDNLSGPWTVVESSITPYGVQFGFELEHDAVALSTVTGTF